ncbi:MAG: hemolysin III family protein, partial [Proteobacteria bacterium]|nr:hemolysin III family protein [Pseudomonadota bacterium]MBU1611649.1 hemolysin III family protein [Pseudomonadota bacterium]
MTEHCSRRHQPKQLLLRDPASGFIHFIGAILSIAALALLVVRAAQEGSAWHVVSCAIFGVGMIGLYATSTACHWFQSPDCPSQWLEKLDHIMIYVLIAATYTPVCLVPLRGPWGWSILGTIWGLAILGSVLKLKRFGSPPWISSALYIAMGWLVLVAAVPMVQIMPTGGLVWMLAGGTCYTIGGIIFALGWPKLIKDVF